MQETTAQNHNDQHADLPRLTGIEDEDLADQDTQEQRYTAMVRSMLSADFQRTDFKFPTDSEVCLPKSLCSSEVSQRVWSRWYGSRRAADRIEQTLRNTKHPEISRLAKKMKHMEPLMFLSFVFGNLETRIDYETVMGSDAFAAIKPESRIEYVYAELLEKYADAVPDLFATYDSIVELAQITEQAWPFMKEIHDLACFREDHARQLMMADNMCRMLNSGAVKPQDEPLVLLAINITFGALMPRLTVLAGIYREAVAKAFSAKMKFAGVTHDTFDPTRSIWKQIDGHHLEETCRQLIYETRSGAELMLAGKRDASTIPAGFQDFAGKIVQASNHDRLLQKLYQLNICNGPWGAEFYAHTRSYLATCAQRLEMNEQDVLSPFPARLVGRRLDLSQVSQLDQAYKVVCQFYRQNRAAAMVVEEAFNLDADRSARVGEIQAELLRLASQTSLANIKAMAATAAEAQELIEQSRGWLLDTLMPAACAYAGNWTAFYDQIAALARPADVLAVLPSPDNSVSEPPSERNLEFPPISAKELVALNDHIQTALADNEHLRRELDDARKLNHKLRSQLAGSPDGRGENIFVQSLDSLDSIYRVALRQSFGPVDVLAFFASTAPDRLVVLPSAWQTAEGYALPYDSSERMLEVMANLVGPYLDALRNGQPDTQARQVLGGKVYSAKESDTTLSNARLRAMREFDFEGKKRLFVQHLRISNEVGARGMRIYFAVDGAEQDKHIVIAYVGPHLELVSTS